MPRRTAPARGFTLLELMVVVTILAGALLLVPANLYRFGAASRLENAGNTLVALVAAAREQAIIDGQPVKVELGTWEDDDGDEHHAHRLVFTNLPAERSELLTPDGGDRVARPTEQEWLTTAWHELPGGVVFSGVSERARDWSEIRQDEPYLVAFGPDGSVEMGFGVRLESEDLEVKTEFRTITVLVNPLTAEAQAHEGYAELAESRDENEFSK